MQVPQAQAYRSSGTLAKDVQKRDNSARRQAEAAKKKGTRYKDSEVWNYELGIDQNKVSGAASIADQPRINRHPNGVISNTILRRDLSKHDYRYLAPGPTHVGWTIADQPRTNRGFHRLDIFWKLKWYGLWGFELCCSDSSLLLAITIEHSFQTNLNDLNVSLKTTYQAAAIGVSSYSSRFSYNKCLSHSRTNHRSIAIQGFTIADVETYMGLSKNPDISQMVFPRVIVFFSLLSFFQVLASHPHETIHIVFSLWDITLQPPASHLFFGVGMMRSATGATGACPKNNMSIVIFFFLLSFSRVRTTYG